MTIQTFGIIGGDLRQLYCARSIADDGFGVLIAGFDTCDNRMGLTAAEPSDIIRQSDAILLPLPVSTDGIHILAPFSAVPIGAEAVLSQIRQNQAVFGGLPGKLSTDMLSAISCGFYGKQEEFAAANAVPTAEGAIEAAMHHSDITLCQSDCLVIGFGRIGRVLSDFLRGLGAHVTVSARQEKDLAFIRASGMAAQKTDSLHGSFQFIFNTVPCRILDRKKLSEIGSEALIIDLASLPGGVDDEAAQRMAVPVIHALSLPGKVAPKTAGHIIKNAVYHLIREASA